MNTHIVTDAKPSAAMRAAVRWLYDNPVDIVHCQKVTARQMTSALCGSGRGGMYKVSEYVSEDGMSCYVTKRKTPRKPFVKSK